jgi:hypothetical protein
MSRSLSTVVIAGLLVGCTHAPPGPVSRDREREALEQAVRWPEPAVATVLWLANAYGADHRERDGQAFFCERARTSRQPRAQTGAGGPLFRALCGMFEARMAPQVSLLRRVAWVNHALGDLDQAAAVDPLSRYLRGLVEAELPARFGRAGQAIEDLQGMLDHADRFPPGLRRGAYRGLALAHETLHQDERAAEAWTRAGGRGQAILSDGSVTARDGFRFGPPRLDQVARGVYVARGYDFADIAFVTTGDGVVAIDAGTSEETARAALAAFREVSRAPIEALILTHAHWDHAGGVRGLVGPGTPIIAQAHFAEEQALVNRQRVPFRSFFGQGTPARLEVAPDRLIARPETVTFGGTSFGLHPVHGGERPTP